MNRPLSGCMPVHFLRYFFKREKESILYLNSLRVHVDFRHKIRFLREGFASITKLISFKTTLPFMFTSIASENFKAKRLLESNLKGMPKYIPLSKMSTFSFMAKQYRNTYDVVQVKRSDISSIVTFHNHIAREQQLAAVLDASWLEGLNGSTGLYIEDFYMVKNTKGEIEALFALWDQRKIKQVVINSYRKPLNTLRLLYNFYAKMSGNIVLPKEGEALEQVFISFFTTQIKDPQEILHILKEASSLIEEKGANLCTIGFASE